MRIRKFTVGNDNCTSRLMSANTLLCSWLSMRVFLSITTVLMTGVLSACQPPASSTTSATAESSEAVDTPIIINTDSVTMSPEYVLSVKPSRYQPSLGLQGNIEPIKQARLITAQDLTIQKVLVTKGQWVEKGTPLLIVQRQTSDKQAANNDTKDSSTIENTIADDSSLAITANTSDSQITDDPATIDPVTFSKDSAVTEPAFNAPLNKKAPTEAIATDLASADTDQPITILASISGRVNDIYVETAQHINARTRLLTLINDTDLRFIATLPIQAEPQLSVGQTVNFTAAGLTKKFTGQVSELMVNSKSGQLLVYVHVVKNEASRGILKPDMAVIGRVDYGQIEVGTILPERGIHDVDLTELQKPPYRPLSPLSANVWIIKQDQRLTRQPVDVIEYDPNTGQYLIAGISNDSLICLAELPLESAGKKVIIS